MKRRVFSLLAGVSMLLCVGSLALWVRSYFRFDQLELSHVVGHAGYPGEENAFVPGDITWSITFRSGKGSLDIAHDLPWILFRYTKWKWTHLSDHAVSLTPIGSSFWNRHGFESADFGGIESEVTTPIWPLTLTSLVFPSLWLVLRMRGRVNSGSCAVCGYDLRATPERCPECGTVPLAPKSAEL